MTRVEKIRAALADAVIWSNYYFGKEEWDLAARWGEDAESLQRELDGLEMQPQSATREDA